MFKQINPSNVKRLLNTLNPSENQHLILQPGAALSCFQITVLDLLLHKFMQNHVQFLPVHRLTDNR